jgi:segregation and condensation protein A
MYMLKLEQFEGPLDLLLALIEKQKLDITRLSLASIAEEYLALLASGQYASLDQMADFLSIASRLLLLKSKSLLPFLVLEAEEEESVEDLEWRLKEYKKCKDAAAHIKTLWEREETSFSKEKQLVTEPSFFPSPSLTAMTLAQTFARVVNAIQLPEVLEERVVEEIISIEERIIALRELFVDRVEASFAETVSEMEDRMEIIVSFLAMLELVKQKILHADQDELFVEIRLRKRS